nr:MAG: replication-associated protein [Canine associated porprismacovirus]
MTVWMVTCPREGVSKKRWFKFFEFYDIHKWVLGRETGKGGYKHWQVRFQTTAFDKADKVEDILEIKEWFKQAHILKASDTWDYETKSGDYFRDDDNDEILLQRFGKFRDVQQRVIETVYGTSDREVVVWCTEEGNVGKSWMCGALWERREAHYVLPQNTAKGLIQDCASEVIQNGKRPIIVIDIPRTWKWTEELYCAIESIKDGLIKDPRYGSRTINIRGTKLLILCNSRPQLDKLSRDRWVILTGADAST